VRVGRCCLEGAESRLLADEQARSALVARHEQRACDPDVGDQPIDHREQLDVAEIAPALILIGVLMFRRAPPGPRDFGRVLIGLGLMLMAPRSFIDLITPYEDVPSLQLLLGAIATHPLLDVVLGPSSPRLPISVVPTWRPA